MERRFDTLIAKFLSGNITAAEKAVLEKWIEASPDNKRAFNRSEEVWRNAAAFRKTADANVDAAWADFEARKASAIRPLVPRVGVMRMAAAVAFVIGLALLIIYFVSRESQTVPFSTQVATNTREVETPSVASVPNAARDTGAQAPAESQSVNAKRRVGAVQQLMAVTSQDSAMKFDLPDGTVVYLNRNSKLTYPENFVRGSRTVYLTGEAFFEVTHGLGEFRVVCQDVQVKVLGTSFNVKGYEPLRKVEVMVEEGLVEVRAKNRPKIDAVLLRKDEQASYVAGQVAITRGKASKSARWWKKAGFRSKIRDMFNRITSKKKS